MNYIVDFDNLPMLTGRYDFIQYCKNSLISALFNVRDLADCTTNSKDLVTEIGNKNIVKQSGDFSYTKWDTVWWACPDGKFFSVKFLGGINKDHLYDYAKGV